jgi:hypothetical protein
VTHYWLAFALAILLVALFDLRLHARQDAARRQREQEDAQLHAILVWTGSAIQTQGKVQDVLIHRPVAFITHDSFGVN